MFSAAELKAAKDKAREEARLSKARGQQQEKHWSWLFSTLWTGLRRSPRLHLSVPETVLFEDGTPTKWLGTDDDGYLIRRDLEPPALKAVRGSMSVPNDVRDEFFASERIKMFAQKFTEAWRRGGGTTSVNMEDESAPAVCVAEYYDGVREDLNVKQLLYLGSHARWRIQVASLQSKVTARRTASGSFRRNAKQSLAPRAEAAARAAAALAAGQPEHASRDDLAHLARALAKFAESTYAPAKSRLTELDDEDIGQATVEDLGLEVDALDVEASVDAQGTLWLVRCPVCHIRFVNRAPARVDAEVFEAHEATREEAKAAGKELMRLLALAAKRGVDSRASFKHFDPQGLGRVDVAGLITGLDLLGTKISDDAAALLQEDLSGSSIRGFSVQDLHRFSTDGPRPRKEPSRAEREVYNVVLGAASATKYSITVEAHAVRTANAELDAQHKRGVEIQERLKVCRVATDDLWSYPRRRRALEREHNRYVAMVVASDIVDDALEWMLEGWHFGERESRYSVAGYVPSLKSDGFVRAGSDQVLAQADAEDRAAKRSNEHRDEAVTGSPRTKAEKIERNAQFRLGTEKVAKDGNDHEKHLDFTETTLKFGLFCITLMFFRAMSLVRRERDTFSGTHDAITSEGNPQKPTEERRKMRREKALLEERQKKMQHVLNRAKVGEERTRKRLAKERAEAASKLHEKVRREKRELTACAKLQAFYRGHLGRKAARRWAVKRAELEAMNALMTASAITIERVFRGYMGRIAASVARMEMAEFISMIRLEEAQADEDEYWRTHGWARLKRNVMMFVRATFERKADVAEEDMKMIQSLTAAMDED